MNCIIKNSDTQRTGVRRRRSGPKPVPDDLVHHPDEAFGRFVFRQLQELCDPRVGELVLGEWVLGYICLWSVVELRLRQCPLHCPYGERAHVAQGPVLVVVVPGFRGLEWVSEELKLSGLIYSIRKATPGILSIYKNINTNRVELVVHINVWLMHVSVDYIQEKTASHLVCKIKVQEKNQADIGRSQHSLHVLLVFTL